MTGSDPADDTAPELVPLFASIGRVIAAGARLEWALVDLHEVLLHSPRGHVVVAGESFDQAKRGCLDLAEHVGEPVHGLVRRAVLVAAEAWSERNRVVHGLWLIGLEGLALDEAVTLSLRRRQGHQLRTWSVAELNELARVVDVAAGDVGNLDVELRSKRVAERLGGTPSFEPPT